jgi:hypothetical protein
MTRQKQFAAIEVARMHVQQWAATRRVPIVHLDVVVPFVETDFSLAAWLFYDTNANLLAYGLDGTTAAAEAEYRAGLSAGGYDPAWLTHVTFFWDSYEDVALHYEGSYFYRLR